MRIIFIIFILIYSYNTNAQNLVKNSSFERYSSHQRSFQYSSKDFFANNWYHFNMNHYSSVDFFSPIHKDSIGYHFFHSSNKYFCTAYPINGNCHIGLVFITLDNQMEHITGTLHRPLIKNNEYEISFYVKHCGKYGALKLSKFEVQFQSELKIDNNTELDNNFTLNILYNELVKLNERACDATLTNDSLLLETDKWIKVTGQYKASGGEKYITLGLFNQGNKTSKQLDRASKCYRKVFTKKRKRLDFLESIDQNLDFIYYNPSYNINYFFDNEQLINGTKDYSYYFIDKVEVIPLLE